ncbi:MAG: capsule assembly Wzi family protein [Duncaniella sp.]|nr:capsule assembly Wzi family protein [Duncaniella sp.]
MRIFKSFTAITLAVASLMTARAGDTVNYQASLTLGAGSGEFSPYYISALRAGRYSGQYNSWLSAGIWKDIDKSERFSYGFGAELAAGYGSGITYDRYDAATESWFTHKINPSAARIQQLYGEVKYRSLFLWAGMRDARSALLDQELTSGDLVESGNARGIPQVRAGFIDFQNVPFTRGWLQIQGEISYGKYVDNGWMKDQFNRWNSHLSTGEYYHYKRLYFRIADHKPFTVTLGMQSAAEFGGYVAWYEKGDNFRSQKRPLKLKDFISMIVPNEDGTDGYYAGNHLGTWDFQARYRFRNNATAKAYFSWPWEDGSGIGKLNGWDGLWGVEYNSGKRAIVTGAVIEYLDLTNLSGPIHFAPVDYPGTTLPGEATGADDYYNNTSYGPYTNYGFTIGTPAVNGTLYNTDGYPQIVTNRMRGFHAAVKGSILPCLDYRLKVGYRQAWGNAKLTLPQPRHLTSVMLEATWHIERVAGLSLVAQAEIDRGNLPCNATGAMVTVRYDGSFKIK